MSWVFNPRSFRYVSTNSSGPQSLRRIQPVRTLIHLRHHADLGLVLFHGLPVAQMGVRGFVVLASGHCGGNGRDDCLVGFGGAEADEVSQDVRLGAPGTGGRVGRVLLQDGGGSEPGQFHVARNILDRHIVGGNRAQHYLILHRSGEADTHGVDIDSLCMVANRLKSPLASGRLGDRDDLVYI